MVVHLAIRHLRQRLRPLPAAESAQAGALWCTW